jgi:hypothetical protein
VASWRRGGYQMAGPVSEQNAWTQRVGSAPAGLVCHLRDEAGVSCVTAGDEAPSTSWKQDRALSVPEGVKDNVSDSGRHQCHF